MLTAPSYDEVNSSLRYYMSPTEKNCDVRLVGLVFSQPYSKFAKDEILPALPYYHRRSGEHVNFYFVGYYQGEQASPIDVKVASPSGDSGWIFSPEAFDNFRRELERRTRWRYSGGSDFILANAQFKASPDESCLDFGSVVAVNFERLVRDGALGSVGMLFESIFSHAESCSQFDSASRFSSERGKTLLVSALKSLFVSILPKSMRDKAEKAFHYASADLRL